MHKKVLDTVAVASPLEGVPGGPKNGGHFTPDRFSTIRSSSFSHRVPVEPDRVFDLLIALNRIGRAHPRSKSTRTTILSIHQRR